MLKFTQSETALLEQTFLFRGYDLSEAAGKLEQIGGFRKHFSRHDIIFSSGEFRRELGIVLCGSVRVTKGDGSLVVSELTAGDLFGAAALFNKEADYVSTLKARTETDVLFLPQEAVRQLINDSETIRENYLTYLSERIRFLSGKVEALSLGSGARKLAQFLLKNQNKEGLVHLPCSMSELAARLDTSRASLYRDMEQMIESGAIQRDGKTIRILKPEQLASR